MQKVQTAKDQVRELANAGREEVAGQLDCMARALRGAGDQLDGEEKMQVGQYTRLAGDKVGAVANYLRDHDAADLVHDVEDFARSNPLVFIGGCAAVGFLLGRFLKASPEVDELAGSFESGAYDTSGYESVYSTEPVPGAPYQYPSSAGAYDTRSPAVPRPPAIDPGGAVVTTPTINTPTNTPDPWRSGGGNGSQGG